MFFNKILVLRQFFKNILEVRALWETEKAKVIYEISKEKHVTLIDVSMTIDGIQYAIENIRKIF